MDGEGTTEVAHGWGRDDTNNSWIGKGRSNIIHIDHEVQQQTIQIPIPIYNTLRLTDATGPASLTRHPHRSRRQVPEPRTCPSFCLHLVRSRLWLQTRELLRGDGVPEGLRYCGPPVRSSYFFFYNLGHLLKNGGDESRFVDGVGARGERYI